MADYEIGGFIFNLPLWVIAAVVEKDAAGTPSGFKGWLTLGVEGKTCLVVLTDRDLAERTLTMLVHAGKIPSDRVAIEILTPMKAVEVFARTRLTGRNLSPLTHHPPDRGPVFGLARRLRRRR